MTQKILRIVFSCVLSLFAAILLLAVGLSHYAKTNICEPTVLLHATENSNYLDQLHSEIQYDWENLLSITGINQPDDIMVLLTPELVKEDAVSYITSAYTATANLDTNPLRTQLTEKINEYIQAQNISGYDEEELAQNISDLVDACIADYRSAVAIPLLPKLLGMASTIAGKLDLIILFAAVGTLFLFLFTFFLQVRRQDTLYYAAISFAANGILLTSLTCLADHYTWIERLPFEDSALKTLVNTYLATLASKLQQYGYLYFITAAVILLSYLLICAIIACLRKYRVEKQYP